MADAADALDEFDVPYEVRRRLRAPHPAADARLRPRRRPGRGLEVIIAGAGGAAHLPGMVASATPLPVIGVPVPLARLDGLDSLLSIVQMPAGVPVATVSIGGARNAGLLAVRILGCGRRGPSGADGRIPGGSGDAGAGQGRGATGATSRRRRSRVKLPTSSKEATMAGWGGNPSFDLFQLPEEHQELRAAIRALSEKEIAPHAADVDENARFPQEALRCAERVGIQRGACARGVRRSGCRFGGDLHRHRGSRPRRRVGLVDPGSQQAGHDGFDSPGCRRARSGSSRLTWRRGNGVLRALRARGRQRRSGDAYPRQSGRG